MKASDRAEKIADQANALIIRTGVRCAFRRVGVNSRLLISHRNSRSSTDVVKKYVKLSSVLTIAHCAAPTHHEVSHLVAGGGPDLARPRGIGGES